MLSVKDSGNILLIKSDKLAHDVYRVTKSFPRSEVYGLTSQMRRAATSVPVNIVEGFSRVGSKSYAQFLLISYGSLQELKYFVRFSYDEGLIEEGDLKELESLAEECAKMLWKTIQTVKKNVNC